MMGLAFPGSLDGKESGFNTGDLGSIPGQGGSPGEGNGNSLQYSCLENPPGQRSLAGYGYSPWGHKESARTERLTHTPPQRWGGLEPKQKISNAHTLCPRQIQLFLLSTRFFFFGCTGSQLQHLGSSVAGCKLSVSACGIEFLTKDRTRVLCVRSVESQPLDYQGRPLNRFY